MKKILLSSVALLGLTAGAMAADLPSRAAPAPVFAAVPVFTWTGFYVGVNAGAGFNANNKDIVVPGFGVIGSNDDVGFTGGGQVGYNYQFGQFVAGLEADIQFADIGSGRNDALIVAFPGLVGVIDNSSDRFFGTVRGRLGFAIDRALVYATGGFAYGDVGNRFGGGDTNSGWTVGGGIEYALTNNIIVGVEGLYVNLGNDKNADVVAIRAGVPVGVFGRGDNEFGVVRARLSYKF
jgi:outer membrane immunogenic protein